MKQMTVISGKGGTGKTSLAACFAALEARSGPTPAVVVDCDVEAPNLHILLGGTEVASKPFSGPPLAEIDWALVPDAARCEAACAFDAIGAGEVDPFRCVGCGVCALVCGEAAVRMKDRTAGTIYERETAYGRFFHAELLPGRPGSGGLVTALRARGEAAALANRNSPIIIDGAPGIGCPVIASLAGCDLAVIVTEPGKGALRDLERLRRLLSHFGTGALVILNRRDIDRSLAREVERYCLNQRLELAGTLPLHDVFQEAAVAGRPAVEMGDADLNSRLEAIYGRVRKLWLGG